VEPSHEALGKKASQSTGQILGGVFQSNRYKISGHRQSLSCFFKLRGRRRLGAFRKSFTNPFLQPQWRRSKSGHKLWQADAQSLPDEIGFA